MYKYADLDLITQNDRTLIGFKGRYAPYGFPYMTLLIFVALTCLVLFDEHEMKQIATSPDLGILLAVYIMISLPLLWWLGRTFFCKIKTQYAYELKDGHLKLGGDYEVALADIEEVEVCYCLQEISHKEHIEAGKMFYRQNHVLNAAEKPGNDILRLTGHLTGMRSLSVGHVIGYWQNYDYDVRILTKDAVVTVFPDMQKDDAVKCAEKFCALLGLKTGGTDEKINYVWRRYKIPQT